MTLRRAIRGVGVGVIVAVALLQNPASFLCEQHHQTFIKNGSQIVDGVCYDVYTHTAPVHRVLLACQP